MRITRLELTNFRSFSNTQVIEFAPVTLLFGPNSIGKSSVLMALAYLQQILEKGHCDPQKLDALGDKTIGGFRSLVHGGDLNSSIKIRLDLEMGSSIYPTDDEDYEFLANSFNAEPLMLPDFGGSVEHFGAELEVAWSNTFERAYVRNYRIWINQEYLGSILSSEDGKNTRINELKLNHPLAVTEAEDHHLQMSAEDTPDLPVSLLEVALDDIVTGDYTSPVDFDDADSHDFYLYQREIGVKCQWGAVPQMSERLKTNLMFSELEASQEHLNYLMVTSFLTSAFLEPIRLTKRFLKAYVAIGPVRVIPDFDYVPNPNPEQGDWADGRAAWDLLHRNPEISDASRHLIKECSRWLGDSDKLNTGYQLANWSLYDVMKGDNNYEGDNHYLAKKRHLLFMEKDKKYPLAASQLGTGISQVLPVLAAAHYEPLDLVSIEQPELHLHPRLQVELADLFVQCSKDRTFLVETHSEHLVLRMLKRMRQRVDEELPADRSGLSPDEISIVFCERTESCVVARKMVLDEDGEFISSWPGGFFAERRKELT